MISYKLGEINEHLSGILWGTPMVVVLIAGGIWLSYCSDFVQLRHFRDAMRHALSGLFKGSKSGPSPFEAVCTALAGTVGTGNIAGVMVALTLGGPGTVFWMWVSALVGMGTKYAEIVLAVKYRKRGDGGFRGGPMYYINNGLGRGFGWLAAAFCVFGATAAFGMGNMMQVGSIVTTLAGIAGSFGFSFEIGQKIIFGMIMALLVYITISGGAKSIGKASSYIVPIMAVLYCMGAIAVIAVNITRLPKVLSDIICGAFSVRAAFGGAAGYGISRAISWGFKRGMFSNEAGLGSSPIAHASAETKSAVEQGMLGVFEVFVDTIIICTLTALMVLCSGVEITYGTVGGAEYCTLALSEVFGNGTAGVFMSVTMVLFAFSSIVGWSLYGQRCVEYLMGEGASGVYRTLFAIVSMLSAAMSFEFIIGISDVMNALMVLPNMTALLLLSPEVRYETRKYFSKKK